MIELLELGHQLEDLIEREQISHSLVYAFLEIYDRTRQQSEHRISTSDETHIGVGKEWEIKYILSRNATEEAMNELDDEITPALPWISVPVTWTSLATR